MKQWFNLQYFLTCLLSNVVCLKKKSLKKSVRVVKDEGQGGEEVAIVGHVSGKVTDGYQMVTTATHSTTHSHSSHTFMTKLSWTSLYWNLYRSQLTTIGLKFAKAEC